MQVFQGASESLFILSTSTGLTQLESLVKVHIGGESLFSPCGMENPGVGIWGLGKPIRAAPQTQGSHWEL